MKKIILITILFLVNHVKAQEYKEYFKDSTIKVSGFLKDKLRTGEWKYFNNDGTLLKKGFYRLDKKDGDWEYYFSNLTINTYNLDKLISEKAYTKEGVLSSIIDYQDGKKISQKIFVAGKLTYHTQYGVYGNVISNRSYYDNSTLRSVKKYDYDYPIGQEKTFYKNGNISSITDHDTKNFTSYYKNGNIHLLKTYIPLDRLTESRVYSKEGVLLSKGFLKENRKVGMWDEYAKDGTLTSSTKYRNGYKIKVWSYYDENKLETTNFFDGKKHGFTKKYKLGKLLEVIEYAYGTKIDSWTYQYLSGEVKTKGKFTNGVRKVFYDNGQLKEIGKYENRKIGNWKYYYQNGNLSSIGFYHDGLKDSLWKTYSSSGGLRSIMHYKNGIKKGLEKNYTDGVLISKREYENDSDFSFISYYKNGNISRKGTFKDASYDGEKKEYNENETLRFISISKKKRIIVQKYYNDGVLSSIYDYTGPNDIYKGYYKSGELRELDSIMTFSKIHIEREYYKNGQLSELTFVKNDKKFGLWKYYEEDGSLKMTKKYKYNLILEKNFFLNGKLHELTTYEKHNNYTAYTYTTLVFYENGKLYSREKREGLKPIEDKEYYYKNGKIKQIDSYDYPGYIIINKYKKNGTLESSIKYRD